MSLLYETQEALFIILLIIVALLVLAFVCLVLAKFCEWIEGWWINRNQRGMIGRPL